MESKEKKIRSSRWRGFWLALSSSTPLTASLPKLPALSPPKQLALSPPKR